jgi:DNA-binding winged helix-turn-helix (wHTH) protein/Flp pilus assembly protein TadD
MDSDIQDLRADREIHLARERPFRLGAVEVRPATREVIGPRGRAVLEPRVMQVLVALARAPGEVLSRDDLIASCWEGRVVGEDAISRVISRLRRLSEGLGRDGWTLETVTKVGYRLLPAGHGEGAVAPRPSPSRRLLAGGGVAAAVAAAGGLVLWRLRPPEVPPEAVLLFDKGNEALRQNLPEQNAQAVAFLREAVAQAPDFADGWGALALAYNASLQYTPFERQGGVFVQAAAAARRALELDPDNPRGAAAIALLTPIYRNWEKAEPLYARAISLRPHEPVLDVAFAKFLTSVGRVKDSVKSTQRAVDREPFAPFYRFTLAFSLWGAGRTEEADLTIRKARERWPRHYALWFLQFYLLSHTGRADQAIALGQDEANWPVAIPAADIQLGLSAARAMLTRAPADVAAAVEAQIAASKRGAGYAENAMSWMSALGRVDEAFQIGRAMYFGEGLQMGDKRFSPDQRRFRVGRTFNTHHLFLPPMAAVRADPRWVALMRDLDIGRYWKATGRRPDDLAWARGFLA